MSKPPTPRELALSILNRPPKKSIFPGHSLDAVFQQNPQLDPRDRAFITHLVQGVMRWRLRLDWMIGQASNTPFRKISPQILNILRMALYQIFFLDTVPDSAAVNEAVKLTRSLKLPSHLSSYVNGVLRHICREKARLPYPDRHKDPVQFLSVEYAYPQWMIRRWIRDWGPDFTEALLNAGNRIPPLTIRTNTLKIDRTRLMERLENVGLTVATTPYGPEGIYLKDFKGKMTGLDGFREGLFQVQDEAAQVTAHLLQPRHGDAVLDVCAGLGGKTTHLTALSGDGGPVLALDINHDRLIHLSHTASRLGIRSIIPVRADASGSLASLFRSGFDKILVDAPCSGLGVLSRHPDGKWNRSESDISRMARLQQGILNGAASLLRKKGRMLYVTCTITREENEGVVTRFLEHRHDFQRENMKDHIPGWGKALVDDQGYFRTFPHIHHMDGFFAALMMRR
ncbi:MAG: 16S rRNA (cytosine(967)-C(5))-methyltransferase RsmB [Deltaproteobacteria bacterium]|nr:16S rRNA (cytosine(967)-C(5))-methyltransferase RsmB [Deltaproteobacteria bacterium]